ncbi:hypothetical protein Bca4012_065981 [Brassica carinata]
MLVDVRVSPSRILALMMERLPSGVYCVKYPLEDDGEATGGRVLVIGAKASSFVCRGDTVSAVCLHGMSGSTRFSLVVPVSHLLPTSLKRSVIPRTCAVEESLAENGG